MREAARATRESVRTRQIQLFLEYTKRWDEEDLLESRAAASQFKTPEELAARIRELYAKDPRKRLELLRVANFYEELAIMVTEGGITLETVRKSFRTPIVESWKLWELAVEDMRDEAERARQPRTAYENFKWLAEVISGSPLGTQ